MGPTKCSTQLESQLQLNFKIHPFSQIIKFDLRMKYAAIFISLAFAYMVMAQEQHIQYRIRRGEIPTRSVNLGGWLVAEHWMTGGSPAWSGVPGDLRIHFYFD